MKILLLSLLLIVSGCAHVPDKEYIETPVFVPVVCEDFGRIEPVQSLPVIFVNAEDNEGNQVLGLSGDQYSNLAIVIKDTLRYIKVQNQAISYYKNCIENHNSNTIEEGEPD